MEEVRFTLTRDDFWRLQLYAFFHNKRSGLRIVLLCVIVMLAIIFPTLIPGATIVSGLSIFFAALVGLLFLVMWLNTSRSGKLMEKRGMHVIRISAQGVQQSNDLGHSSTSWRAFKEIKEDKNTIYFRLENPGSVFMVFLIPKRAFQSQQQAERFVELARAYWREQSGQFSAQA